MSYITIYEAIVNRLQTITNLPTLQKENNRVKLGNGKTAWSRATILPARTKIETLGVNGYNEVNGLVQIDLFYPSDASYTDSFTMIDLILDKFVIGTQLSNVIIQNSYPLSAQTVSTSSNVPNFYMSSVMIEYSLYEQRQTIV